MYASHGIVFSKPKVGGSKIYNTIKPTQPIQNAINMDNAVRISMPFM